MQTKRVTSLIVFLAIITVGCLGGGAIATTPRAAVVTSEVVVATPEAVMATPEAVVTPPAAVFTTPEEAITSYLEGVAQSDVQKILQACAIDEMSEKFKFDLYAERLGGVFLPAQFLSPTDYPFYVESNKFQLSSQTLSRVKILVYGLLSTENVGDGSTITGMNTERTTAFIKAVDPKRLSGLEVKKIGLPAPTLMNSAKYKDNAAKSALSYGADESTERVALLSFEQNYYTLGFTLLRYGESWKISSPTSALANTSALGAPEKTTVEEFDNLVNSK